MAIARWPPVASPTAEPPIRATDSPSTVPASTAHACPQTPTTSAVQAQAGESPDVSRRLAALSQRVSPVLSLGGLDAASERASFRRAASADLAANVDRDLLLRSGGQRPCADRPSRGRRTAATWPDHVDVSPRSRPSSWATKSPRTKPGPPRSRCDATHTFRRARTGARPPRRLFARARAGKGRAAMTVVSFPWLPSVIAPRSTREISTPMERA
jgi:hypothetical protein